MACQPLLDRRILENFAARLRAINHQIGHMDQALRAIPDYRVGVVRWRLLSDGICRVPRKSVCEVAPITYSQRRRDAIEPDQLRDSVDTAKQ